MISPQQWRDLPAGVNAVVDFGTFKFGGIAVKATALVGPKPPLVREVFWKMAES